MNRSHKRLAAVLLAVCLVASGTGTAAPTDPPEVRAAAAAQAFSSELRGTLLAAITSGGLHEAVRVCHDEAPRIARRIADTHGVRLGRVGVRSRQPANRLDGWQKDVLDAWGAAPPAGPPAQWAPVVRRDAATATTRWAKAIETEGACLACHGPAIDPRLAQAIRQRYPDDPATGFGAGSLRGLIWVEVPESDTAGPDRPAVPATTDSRQSIPLAPGQAANLRRQMRTHLERIEGVMGALAQNDTTAAAALLAQAAARGGVQAGPDDFRASLPEGWRRFAGPMHAALDAAAARATAGDTPGALGHLGAALGQCNGCHVTFRIEDLQP